MDDQDSVVVRELNDSWEPIVDLSIVHFMIFPDTMAGSGPIVETVSRIVNDDFFSMIEVGHINEPEVRREVAELIATSHMRVAFGAQPAILSKKLDLSCLEGSKRKEALVTLKPLMDEAKEIGASRFTVLSGPDPGANKRADARKLLIESLLDLCSYGKERGVNVTLETFDRSVEKKSLIGPSEEAAMVAAAVKEQFPSFGLMYDMGHAPLLDEDPAQSLKLLKDYLVHIHVGNCVKKPGLPAYGDQHPRFGFYDSENDVPQLVHFLRALFDIGYLSSKSQDVSPVVGFELKPARNEKPEAVIANGKRTWRKAWSLL